MAKKTSKTKDQLELKEESNEGVATEMESQRKFYEQTTAEVLSSQNSADGETSESPKAVDGEIDSSMSLDEIQKEISSLQKEKMEIMHEYKDKLENLYDKFDCDPQKNHEKIVKYEEGFLSWLFESHLNDLDLVKEMLYCDYDEWYDKFAEGQVTLEDVANELSKIENLQLCVYIVKKLISKERKSIGTSKKIWRPDIFFGRSDGNKNLYNPKANDYFNEITGLGGLGINLYKTSDYYEGDLYGYDDDKLGDIRDAIKKMGSNYSIRFIDKNFLSEREDKYYFPLFFDGDPLTTWQKEYFQMHPEIKSELESIKTPNKEIQDLYHEYINPISKLQGKISVLSELHEEKKDAQALSKWSKGNFGVYRKYKKDKDFIEKYGEFYSKYLLEKVKEVVDLYPEIDLSKNWNKLIQFIIAIDDVEKGKSTMEWRNHYSINTLKGFDPEHIIGVFLYDKTTFIADASEYGTEVIVLNGGDIQRQYFKYRDAINYENDDLSNSFSEVLGVRGDDDGNVKIDVTADKIITLKFDNTENEVSEYAIINEGEKRDFKKKVQSYKDNWLKKHTLNKTFLPYILTKFNASSNSMFAFQGEIPYEKASVFDEVINYNQGLAAIIIKTQSDENNRCGRQYMYYGYIITSEGYQCLWQDNLWDREIHEQSKTIDIKAKDIIKMGIEAREKGKLKVFDLVDNQ